MVRNNTERGADLGGDRLEMAGGRVYENNDGIYTHYASYDVVVHDVEVFGNHRYGIEVNGSKNTMVRDNVVHDNGLYGIYVYAGSNPLVKGNTVYGHRGNNDAGINFPDDV